MPSPTNKVATAAVIGVASTIASSPVYDFTYKVEASTLKQPAAPKQTAQAGNPVMISEPLLEAKLEAVEARTETKFAQLLGKLDTISERLAHVATDVEQLQTSIERVETKTTNTRIVVVTTVIGAALTVIGLTFALVGYGHQIADSISAAYAAGQSAKP